jgi:hypothetical protein
MNPAVLRESPTGISDNTKLSPRTHAHQHCARLLARQHCARAHQLSAPDTHFSMAAVQEIVGETL